MCVVGIYVGVVGGRMLWGVSVTPLLCTTPGDTIPTVPMRMETSESIAPCKIHFGLEDLLNGLWGSIGHSLRNTHLGEQDHWQLEQE